MKIMFISDIHGSYTYAKKALEMYELENADKLVILGDILYHGPRNDLPDGYAPKKVIKLLNDYKNKDEKMLLAEVLDKIENTNNRNKIEHTDFLDLAQNELVQKFLNKQKVENYIKYGGFNEAERKMYIFYPEKFNEQVVEKNLSSIVQIIRIELPDDLIGKYTHRDYLGAVMKLGVKREKVGDIIVENNGADIIIDKEITKFLEQNLSELTRFSKSTITVEDIQNLRNDEVKKEEIEIIVASLRLDNVASELSRCSRSKIIEIMNTERVFVNFQVETKKTKQIKAEIHNKT